MSEIDKILEAEQSIHDIVTELSRMRDAATLLQDAQQKTDAILKAAAQVIKVSEGFTIASGEIIRKLSTTDLTERFNTLQEAIKKNADLINNQAKQSTNDLTMRFNNLDDSIKQNADLVISTAKQTASAIATIEIRVNELENTFQKNTLASKSRHARILVLIVLALVTACAGIISVFQVCPKG